MFVTQRDTSWDESIQGGRKAERRESEDLDGILSPWNSLVKQTQFLWLPSYESHKYLWEESFSWVSRTYSIYNTESSVPGTVSTYLRWKINVRWGMSDNRYIYLTTEKGQPRTEPDRGNHGRQRDTERKTRPRNFIVSVIPSWPAPICNPIHLLFTSADVQAGSETDTQFCGRPCC